MSGPAAHVLQRLTIAQQQARERVPRVVNAATPDLSFVAGFPENTVPEIIHIDVISFVMTNRFAVLPDDLPRCKEDVIGDFILATGQIFSLASFLEFLEFSKQHSRDINGSLFSRLRFAFPPTGDLSTD